MMKKKITTKIACDKYEIDLSKYSDILSDLSLENGLNTCRKLPFICYFLKTDLESKQ